VPDVEADQQSCNLFHDARVFQFAAVDGADAGNLGGQIAHDLDGSGIVAANNHIAVDWTIDIEQFGSCVVKGGYDGNALGHKLSSLLRCGALPDAQCAGRRDRQRLRLRNGRINDDAAGTNRGLELLQQRGVTFEWNCEHE
jgi:hypothetical protein